jgi:hypothetical protein
MVVSKIRIYGIPATIFLLAVILMLPIAGQTEDEAFVKIVEVIGTGRIYGDDVPTAKSRATSNSLISAVALVAADLLTVDSMVRNFQMLNEVIYSRTGEFIRDYKVLTSLASGKEYRVMIQVSVLVDKMEEQLSNAGIILVKKEMPKVLFLISEQKLGDLLPTDPEREDSGYFRPFSESAMAETMKSKGFFVIDPGNMVRFTEGASQPFETEINDSEAVRIGLQFQADVVIIGKSLAYKTSNVMGENIRSFQGIVRARALRTDSGEEIASTTQTAIITHTDEISGGKGALSNAGTLAGEALAFQITESWQKEEKKPEILEILVEGTGDLANFVKFRRVIREMAGVTEIQIKEMKPNEATLLVNFEGSAKALADALMLKRFDSMAINIYEVSAARLKIALIPG